ncbi:hypothetical protein SAMN05216386_1437 [Nitrosospira briensis]|uniref:Uncharacterized protein n=1 Tax=Nitrosospira briensis TaxID=35799 RepID=A0A1I5AL76_9PROT|nr:hypothetical protein SAMN05216386_1437 [Nitrosospira briensis]
MKYSRTGKTGVPSHARALPGFDWQESRVSYLAVPGPYLFFYSSKLHRDI